MIEHVRLPLTVGIALGIVAWTPTFSSSAVSKPETKCSSKLAKSAGKLADAIIKETSRCRNDDISGKAVGACPSPAATQKIDAAATKLADLVGSSCLANCSHSVGLTCILDEQCPPRGATDETCGPLSDRFDVEHLGFPGPFCEGILGSPVASPADIASCVDDMVRSTATELIDGVYGTITNASDTSEGADSCLRAIASASRKLTNTVFKGVSKCRAAIHKGKRQTNPRTCARDDSKLLQKITSATDQLRSAIASQCSTAALLKLDLCGNGIGGTTTVAEAQDCVVDLAREVADATEPPILRDYSEHSLVDAAFPPKPTCGDNLLNQVPSSTMRRGEECDGAVDAACPGACLPPGDLFQSTCSTIPRSQFLVDKDTSETDAGWTGVSHNQDVADLSGFVTTLENCDCDAFTNATCTGTSVDPICDVAGRQQPACSWAPFDPLTCDQLGNSDGSNDNRDCYTCDAASANPGAPCSTSADCQSQCYAGGVPSGPCSEQSDCAVGEICLGRCDKEQYCILIREGGPQPVDTAGTTVCTIQTFRENVTGTRNIQTGEHELFYTINSTIHTGDDTSRPCPVCGGFCVGGKQDLEVCKGTCDASGDPCRFDTDCPSGEQCTASSPDCPGGFCQLSLVCGTSTSNPLTGETITGKPCEITYEHRAFGTLSHDCAPLEGQNFSGPGLFVEFSPVTSEAVSLPSIHPCTAPGYELYDCPCTAEPGGTATRPNTCTPACDAVGPDFGVGCANGNTAGFGTVCDIGVNANRPCDEDADCPGGSCSNNPTHCTGDPSRERFLCSTNADCGVGTCVDACPSGRCVPLCIPSLDDALDGECAAGPPLFRCESEKFKLKSCNTAGDLEGSTCNAMCSVSAIPCTSENDCPTGEQCEGPCISHKECEAGNDGILGTNDDEIGAGACLSIPRDCFLPSPGAEGGDTFNGQGDPTNVSTVAIFCQQPTVSSAINVGAGFSGPNRIRKHGVNVVNVTSLP